METKAVSPDKMSTLKEALDKALREGYNINFQVETQGLTGEEIGHKKYYRPEEVRILNFYRFEGASDPDDSSILYLIETNDHGKGSLVDAYGIYADTRISDFIHEVEEIQKKDPNNKIV